MSFPSDERKIALYQGDRMQHAEPYRLECYPRCRSVNIRAAYY
jgi:hypothetical protein